MADKGLIQLDARDAQRLAVALGRARKDEGKWLAASNRKVAARARGWTRMAAAAGTPQERRSASAISSSATRSAARLIIRNTARAPYAGATFYGAKRHTGWYARPQYRNSRSNQHAPWVGNRWRVGVRGEGPYRVNDALASHMDEIEEIYLAAQFETIDRAVPRRFTRIPGV